MLFAIKVILYAVSKIILLCITSLKGGGRGSDPDPEKI